MVSVLMSAATPRSRKFLPPKRKKLVAGAGFVPRHEERLTEFAGNTMVILHNRADAKHTKTNVLVSVLVSALWRLTTSQRVKKAVSWCPFGVRRLTVGIGLLDV